MKLRWLPFGERPKLSDSASEMLNMERERDRSVAWNALVRGLYHGVFFDERRATKAKMAAAQPKAAPSKKATRSPRFCPSAAVQINSTASNRKRMHKSQQSTDERQNLMLPICILKI